MEILNLMLIIGIIAIWIKLNNNQKLSNSYFDEMNQRIEDLNRKIDDVYDSVDNLTDDFNLVHDIQFRKEMNKNKNWMDHADELKREGY